MNEASDLPPSVTPGIGARLREAREARGESYDAIAAELRIRPVILAAMEREDHAALPERVYLLGLLRTYARHLGLDPAAVAAAWGGNTEMSSSTDPSVPLGGRERQGGTPSGGLRLALRGIFGLGLVGIAVLAATAFLLVQLVRFASPPGISVVSPSEEVLTLSAETRVAVIRGTAGTGTIILIQSGVGESVTTEADASGIWSVEVPLGGGRTEVDISAIDPATGSSSGDAVRRVFIVNLPISDAPRLDLLSPTAGLRVSGGAVPVALTAEPNGIVRAIAVDASGTEVLSSFTADSSGTIQGDLSLPAGSWSVRFQATGPNGTVSEVLREVEVVFAGVTVNVVGSGGGTWIRAWTDGAIDSSVGPTGVTLRAGESRTLRGSQAVDIRFGNPRGAVVTLNGRMLEPLGTEGVPQSWSFRDDGRVLSSARK
ncbi:MAG: RodZ domain-containing protein [Candidatus Limnocylindrus sp.]